MLTRLALSPFDDEFGTMSRFIYKTFCHLFMPLSMDLSSSSLGVTCFILGSKLIVDLTLSLFHETCLSILLSLTLFSSCHLLRLSLSQCLASTCHFVELLGET